MTATSRVRRYRAYLGTFVTIVVEAQAPENEVFYWIDEAFACIGRVEQLMSFHDPDSELTRMNRLAAMLPVEVDAWTFQVLAHALEIGKASSGAFDISIAPRLEKWGFLPKHRGLVRPTGGLHDIELTPNFQVRYHRPLRVDLGGIAKGFAVDRALELLLSHGPRYVSVDAGGDFRQAGKQEEGLSEFFLRNPQAPHGGPVIVPMHRAAVATSSIGLTERRHRFRQVNHLVHPHSGRPHDSKQSVSVFAPDCMTADALTKVVMFSDPETWKPLLARERAVATMITEHGEIIHHSP